MLIEYLMNVWTTPKIFVYFEKQFHCADTRAIIQKCLSNYSNETFIYIKKNVFILTKKKNTLSWRLELNRKSRKISHSNLISNSRFIRSPFCPADILKTREIIITDLI